MFIIPIILNKIYRVKKIRLCIDIINFNAKLKIIYSTSNIDSS